jgi:large subunit ribosomal protein L24
LSAGALSVASAQIPFNIRDGRIRIGATTLDADGARAIISGGYDIPADQADIRVGLAATATASASSRPEIQLFAAGSPDALDRTVDVAALSSWLAVRAIDRETRRLDSIERGEPPPAVPASIPPSVVAPPAATAPKPKVSAPRPPFAPPVPGPPVAGQQAAPLPPPIEVRPAPNAFAPAAPRPPKPRPPLVLTPPPANPPRQAF